MTLIFDTETTGKAHFNLELTHPSQPRMCQLAAALYDDSGKAVARIALPIQSRGAWKMPAEAEAIHGWSDDKLDRCGVRVECALQVFGLMVYQASVLVAFNVAFDHFVVEGEMARVGLRNPFNDSDVLVRCAMLEAKDHCRLPGKYGDYKWPKLTEAHKYFFGSPHTGAHDALADVEATARVWFEMRRLEKLKEAVK